MVYMFIILAMTVLILISLILLYITNKKNYKKIEANLKSLTDKLSLDVESISRKIEFEGKANLKALNTKLLDNEENNNKNSEKVEKTLTKGFTDIKEYLRKPIEL